MGKVIIDGGELDDIKIYGILGLEHLPRAVFIDCGCWNLGSVVDGGEVAGGVNNKEGPDILQA